MLFVTDCADLAVVLPLVVAVAVALLAAPWPRGAAAWALVVPATLLTVLLTKMAVAACGAWLPLHGLRSPSGHTASAAVVYGGLLSLLLPEPRRGMWRAVAVALVAGVFAVLFGGTRLALHVHTRSDVLAGAALGIAGALIMARLAGPRPQGLRVAIPLATAVAVVLLFHGRHIHAEDQIDRISHLVWPLTLCRRQR